MLACLYFADIKEFEQALNELNAVKETWLYELEKERFKLQRALLLMQMGRMKAAYQLLGDPDMNLSDDPMVWFAYSFIFENSGNIDKTLQYAEKSRDIVDAGYKGPDFVLAEVYNNYSRVAIFKGNRQEALRYLDIAWKKVKRSRDMRTVHIVASNRIAQMALAGRSHADCAAALKDYRELIPKVVTHLNHSQRVLYTASTFRMLMNGYFEHKWFDKNVKSGMKEYDDLTLMDKLVVFKEYMGLFQQEEMTQKLGILKLTGGKRHIDQSKELYIDLYKQLYDSGLHLDAIHVLTMLIDECSSPYNILLWSPCWLGAMFYSDYIENSPPVPDPLLGPDGIHLQYYRLQISKPFVVRSLHDDIIREHIDTVISEFRSWKNHPFKVALSIEIGHILMCLDRKEEAKEFLQFFEDSGVSVMQLAS